jgi:endonuclease/exonuclease/phosphatase (EEP) superfamily protein YafD
VVPSIGRAVAAGAWIIGVSVLAGLGLHHGFGDETRLGRYTGYVMPWLLVGLLPGAVWGWLTHRRMLSVVLGVSVAIVLGTHVPRLWRPDATAPPSAMTLEVMSYNTWSRNHDARRIAHVIRTQAPDLLLLQEILPEVFDDVMDLLPDLYGGSPVHCAYDPTIRQAVVSRHPVEPRASMPEKGQAQEVVVRSPGGPITVLNVHPLRHGGWRQRYGQMASLLEEHVLGEKGPVILAGDFNASDHSQLYGLIAGHLRNAHREVGVGFGFTYPASGYRVLGVPGRPVARIDHVFFSDHFVALRAGTLEESGGSDHRPVFAELALEPGAPDDARGRAAGAPAEERRTGDRGREIMLLQAIRPGADSDAASRPPCR